MSYHGDNTELVSQHEVRLPKDSCVTDVLDALSQQLPEDKRPAALRLLEVFYSKIYKVPFRYHALGRSQTSVHPASACTRLLIHSTVSLS